MNRDLFSMWADRPKSALAPNKRAAQLAGQLAAR